MDKQQKIKQLTWSYFWGQKIKEVTLFILSSVGVIFIPFYIGKLMSYLLETKFTYWFCCNNEEIATGFCRISLTDFWGMGFITLISFIGSIFIIFSFGKTWVESNWEKAKAKAKKDMKNERYG